MKGPYRAFGLLGWVGGELLFWTLGPYFAMKQLRPGWLAFDGAVVAVMVIGLVIFFFRLFRVLKRFED